ncbi:MAG: hypothetical protein ACC656_11370, partial [Candidatus Heimdallarchaeota archaeon]
VLQFLIEAIWGNSKCIFYCANVIDGVPLNFVDFDQSFISIDTIQHLMLFQLDNLTLMSSCYRS